MVKQKFNWWKVLFLFDKAFLCGVINIGTFVLCKVQGFSNAAGLLLSGMMAGMAFSVINFNTGDK